MDLTPHMKFTFCFNDIKGILLKSIKASTSFDKRKLRQFEISERNDDTI